MMTRRIAALALCAFAATWAAAADGSAPPAGESLALASVSGGWCSCWCWCVRIPTTGACNGGGTCCWGSEARQVSRRSCGCSPCVFIFGGAGTERASCDRAVQMQLDLHIGALRQGAGTWHAESS